jgi:hypothetical protein
LQRRGGGSAPLQVEEGMSMPFTLHLRGESNNRGIGSIRRGLGWLIALSILLSISGRTAAQEASDVHLIPYDQRAAAWVVDDATSFSVAYKCSIIRLNDIWPSHSCTGEVRVRDKGALYSNESPFYVVDVESVYRSGGRFSVGGRVVELVGFEEWAQKALMDEKERVKPQLIQEFLSVAIVLGLLTIAAMLVWSLLIRFFKNTFGFLSSFTRPRLSIRHDDMDGVGQIVTLGGSDRSYPSALSIRIKGMMLIGLGGAIWVVGIPLSVAWIAFCFSNIVIGVLMLFLLPPVLLGPILFSVFGGLKCIIFGLAMLFSRY